MFYHHGWQNQSWTWPTTINMQIWRGMKEESTNINTTQSLQRYFYSICKYIHRYVIYIHIHVWVLLQCLTLLVNYPNNGYLVTEVQEPTSCLFQAKYHRWTSVYAGIPKNYILISVKEWMCKQEWEETCREQDLHSCLSFLYFAKRAITQILGSFSTSKDTIKWIPHICVPSILEFI